MTALSTGGTSNNNSPRQHGAPSRPRNRRSVNVTDLQEDDNSNDESPEETAPTVQVNQVNTTNGAVPTSHPGDVRRSFASKNTKVNCLHVNSAAVQPRTIMSTTIDDYTTQALTAPDPYQTCWGDSIGTAFVGDDSESDDESDDEDEGFVRGNNDDNDDSLGYGDPEDFWMAD